MAQLAKFHEKAIAIYGCAQLAENVSAISTPTGTITVSLNATAVTGTGFLTKVAIGSYLYTSAAVRIGRVLAIPSDTSITLEPINALGTTGAEVAMAAQNYATGLGPKNAIAVLNLNFSTELTSEAFQYTGDELDRDEATVITDRFAKFDFETFLPVKGTTSSTVIASEVPLSDWFQSAGMAVTLYAGKYSVTNATASNTYMTIEIRRSSPDITTQKTYTITNARGLFDLDLTLGTKPKMKFAYQGNVGAILSVEKAKLTPDFQNQKTAISESIKSTTVNLAKLDVWSGSTVPTYQTVTAGTAPTGTSNLVFNKLTAPNLTGFEYARYMTSDTDGWSKGASPTDVTLTILEDTSAAAYNPDTNLEKSHALTLSYSDTSDTAGKVVTIIFRKLELTKVTNSKVANYTGQDLGFRNIGFTDIIFS